LPLFVGQVSDIPALLTAYQQYNAMFAPYHVSLTMLSVDDLGDWQLKTTAGCLMDLGSEDMVARLQTFLSGYPSLLLSRPNNTPLYVDLRYRSGFAVKWQYATDVKRKRNGAQKNATTKKKTAL